LERQEIENVALEPGGAVYLLGGRESLPKQLDRYGRGGRAVKTADGSGLVLAAQSKIAVSDADRFAGYFKSTLQVYTGSRSLKEDKQEYNELRRRTLTCVCLYNSNLDGTQAPAAPITDRLIGDRITLQEVGQRLAQAFNDRRIDQAAEERQQRNMAVHGLMRDLHIA
jgi:hypothetical protein